MFDDPLKTVMASFRRLVIAASIILVVTSGLLVSEGNDGHIEGRVVRANSPDGIANVQISLIGPSPADVPMTSTANDQNAARRELELRASSSGGGARLSQLIIVTDSNGRFSFNDLSPGHYQIRAQADGYLGITLPDRTSMPVAAKNTLVVAGQQSPAVVLTLVRSATISGKVRDPKDQPLSGAQVRAYQLTYPNGRPALYLVTSKVSDDHGEYRIFGLLPGEYLISATLLPVTEPTASYARTYYPGTSDARIATRVKATEGAEIQNVDIDVRADAVGRISGRIIGPADAGQQLPAPSIFLLEPRDPDALWDALALNMANSSANRSNGQFDLPGVLPGSYDMIASVPLRTQALTPPSGTEPILVGRTRVEVGKGPLENVTLFVRRGVEVKARLTVDGGPAPFKLAVPPTPRGGSSTSVDSVPTPTIQLQLRTMEPAGPFASRFSAFDRSGIFTFSNVPDTRYTIVALNLPPNTYIADIRSEGKSIYDQGFIPESLTGEIEVLVVSSGATVQGYARDSAKKPFAAARIALVPQTSRRNNTALYRTAVSDASGNFALTAVPPGEYQLFAWESAPPEIWMNPDFMKRYESQGQTITIKGGESFKTDVNVLAALPDH